jgi:hypothetical protein
MWCHNHGNAEIHEDVEVRDENGNLVETDAAVADAAVPIGYERIIESSREPLFQGTPSAQVVYASRVPLFEVTPADEDDNDAVNNSNSFYDSARIDSARINSARIDSAMEVDTESRKRSDDAHQPQPKVRMIEGTSMVPVNNRIDGLTKDLHTLRSEIAPFADFLKRHAGSIEGREGIISDRVGRIDAQIRALNETSDRVCTVNDKIRTEHSEVAKSLDDIRYQLKNMMTRVDAVEDCARAIETKVKNNERDMKTTTETVYGLYDEAVDEVAADKNAARIAADTAAAAAAAATAAATAAARSAATARDAVAATSVAAAASAKSAATAKSAADAADASAAAATAAADGIANAVNALRAETAAATAAADGIANAVNALRAETAAATAAAATAKDAARAAMTASADSAASAATAASAASAATTATSHVAAAPVAHAAAAPVAHVVVPDISGPNFGEEWIEFCKSGVMCQAIKQADGHQCTNPMCKTVTSDVAIAFFGTYGRLPILCKQAHRTYFDGLNAKKRMV